MKKLVIIPGGFHPFHAGHMSLYNAARDAFPSADVYVAATNDKSTRPFPFKLKKMLAVAAGVPANRFIEVKSPFRSEEITQHYDPDTTQLIYVRSEKDKNVQPVPGGAKKDGEPGYLQPYKRNGRVPMSKHGYMTYLPTVQFGPGMSSATEIRSKWPEMSADNKIKLIQTLYPNTAGNERAAQKLADIIDQVLSEGVAGAVVGGIAGAALTKTPAGAVRGAQMGSAVQNAVSETEVDERKLTGAEKRSKEVNFKKLKPELDDFKKRYGKDAESVMHAVATKQAKAKSEDVANEATMANADDGQLVYPDGGLGGYSPDGLERAVIRHFEEVLAQAKRGNLEGVEYLLYKGGVIESKLRALQQYQKFLEKRGRRPLAKGKTYDLANEDYLEE